MSMSKIHKEIIAKYEAETIKMKHDHATKIPQLNQQYQCFEELKMKGLHNELKYVHDVG